MADYQPTTDLGRLLLALTWEVNNTAARTWLVDSNVNLEQALRQADTTPTGERASVTAGGG